MCGRVNVCSLHGCVLCFFPNLFIHVDDRWRCRRSVPAIRVNWLLIFHSTFYLGAVNLKARASCTQRRYCFSWKLYISIHTYHRTTDCTSLNIITLSCSINIIDVPCLSLKRNIIHNINRLPRTVHFLTS